MEGCHLGNSGIGMVTQYREFCILFLNNHWRANNSIILCYCFHYTHIYIHIYVLILCLLSVRSQVPISVKRAGQAKQPFCLKISAQKGDSDDILQRNNWLCYNYWDAYISVLPLLTAVSNVPFRPHTQSNHTCYLPLQETVVNASCNVKCTLIQFYRDIKNYIIAAVWKASAFEYLLHIFGIWKGKRSKARIFDLQEVLQGSRAMRTSVTVDFSQ